jgi:serine O-acetyltransferase
MMTDGQVSETSLHIDWQEPDDHSRVPFWSSVMADVLAHCYEGVRPSTKFGWRKTVVRVALKSSGFRAALLYRIAHCCRMGGGFPGKVIAFWINWFVRHWYGCTLSPHARIYGGLIMPHPHGIVIGPGVVLGPRSWIFQNVTLGGAPGKIGMPTVGSDSRIFTGAVISGLIKIGDGVTVGANCVVSRGVPSGTVVRPAPVALSAEI